MEFFEKIKRVSKADNKDKNNTERETNYNEKLPRPVYYVESPNDDTVLVGIDVSINRWKKGMEEVNIVRWYDTTHERVMTASDIQKKDDSFAFERDEKEGGGYYHFSPMNLDIYNDKVKFRLMSGKDFKNDNDLIEAFLKTIEDEF